MTVFNTENILKKLSENPAAGAAFDRINPGTNRRDAIVACLAANTAALAENKALKAKILAAKQKQVALLEARKRLLSNQSIMKPPAPKPTAAPLANTTAADYEPQPVTMKMSEFNKLSPAAKSAFCIKTKGKIIS